jgi:hypothetical protein
MLIGAIERLARPAGRNPCRLPPAGWRGNARRAVGGAEAAEVAGLIGKGRFVDHDAGIAAVGHRLNRRRRVGNVMQVADIFDGALRDAHLPGATWAEPRSLRMSHHSQCVGNVMRVADISTMLGAE